MSGPPPDSALALLASVGRLLNAGNGLEATFADVAEVVRTELPADAVVVWLREVGRTTWQAVGAPAPAPGDGPGVLASLDRLPPPGPGVLRLPLVHEGERLGLLEATLPDGGKSPGTDVLEVLAGFLAPYLAAAELSTGWVGEHWDGPAQLRVAAEAAQLAAGLDALSGATASGSVRRNSRRKRSAKRWL